MSEISANEVQPAIAGLEHQPQTESFYRSDQTAAAFVQSLGTYRGSPDRGGRRCQGSPALHDFQQRLVFDCI